jgi:hypothetical protein
LQNALRPSGLQNLTFGFNFNQPEQPAELDFWGQPQPEPAERSAAQRLAEPDSGVNFIQSLQNALMPSGLQNLTFGFNFNQSLRGLQSLTFGVNLNQNLQNAQLHSGLQSLTPASTSSRACRTL